MKYPVAIEVNELMSFLDGREKVASALCDERGNLLTKTGDEVYFGLDNVNKGQYIANHFFFLEGIFPLDGVPFEIYEMEFESNKFINVFCIPTIEGNRIIFQDVSEMMQVKSKVHEKVQEVMVFLDNYRKNIQ